MKKKLAMFTAAVLSLGALPVFSVGAESAFVPGDLDMDGVLTGHDTAMVSRYLLDDAYTLTDAQLALADANEDGAVDQADADWLSANEVYRLGDVDMDSDVGIMDGFVLFRSYAKRAAGWDGYELTQVQLNLGNVTANPDFDITENADSVIKLYSCTAALLFDDLPQDVYGVVDGANQYYFGR